MKEFNKYIALSAMDLDTGDTLRVVCPACGGGTGKEKSLCVTRTDDGLVYTCHRSKCDVGGGFVRTKSPSESGAVKQQKVAREYEPLSLVHPTALEYDDDLLAVMDRFHLNATEVRCIGRAYLEAAPSAGRVAWTIVGPTGKHRGYVRRGYHGQTPKALNWFLPGDQLPLSWHLTPDHIARRTEYVVAVEDIPSAIRLQQNGVDAVSLLGSHVSPEQAMELSKYAPRLVWALDEDATDKALKLNQKWTMFFEHSYVRILKGPDIKDMNEQEFQAWVNGL